MISKTLNKCDNNECNRGRGFKIRDAMFCSPSCGNKHFNLSKGDEDYWTDESEEQEKKDEKSRKKLNQIFPDAKFTIDVDYLPRLNYLFTSKKKIFIRAIPTNYTFEVIGDKITYKYIFNELIKQKFTPKTDFNFFSHFRKMDDDMFDMIFV